MIMTVTMNPALEKHAQVNEFIYGGVNSLSNLDISVSGKGINVSYSIQQLKGRSLVTGIVGGSNGGVLLKELEMHHLSNDMVRTKGNTRVNLTLVDENNHVTQLNEEMEEVEETTVLELQMKLERLAKCGDVVVLSGSVPPNVPVTIYQSLTASLKAQGVKVIVDGEGGLLKEAIKAQPSIIKVNQESFASYLQIEESELDEARIIQEGKQLIDLGTSLVIVSLGRKGAYFITGDQVIQVDALKVDVVSTNGAGDAMVGACAIALQHHYDLETLIRLAIAAATSTVISEKSYVTSYDDVCMYQQQVVCNKKE